MLLSFGVGLMLCKLFIQRPNLNAGVNPLEVVTSLSVGITQSDSCFDDSLFSRKFRLDDASASR